MKCVNFYFYFYFSYLETDNSLQPGMPQMQQQRPQFRHPLPPDVRPQSPGIIRGMGPNIQVLKKTITR